MSMTISTNILKTHNSRDNVTSHTLTSILKSKLILLSYAKVHYRNLKRLKETILYTKSLIKPKK